MFKFLECVVESVELQRGEVIEAVLNKNLDMGKKVLVLEARECFRNEPDHVYCSSVAAFARRHGKEVVAVVSTLDYVIYELLSKLVFEQV